MTDELAPGTIIGPYILNEFLGGGGMGWVYRAFDGRLKRSVALKVLRRELGARQQHLLTREAQAMAQLSHPNVVQIHEIGEHQGRSYIVMELVEGQTLRTWQRRTPRPDWRACVAAYLQAGAALAAAHDRSLIHRDFKPSNVMIDDHGRVQVLDFGLARATGEDGPDAIAREESTQSRSGTEHSWVSERLTQTGAVVGTPAYMPLEQMQGEELDARGDQFSFCVSLWEALYGIRPFSGKGSELEHAIKEGRLTPVPPDVQIPDSLQAALWRGLSAEPDQRWPSMEALLEQLRRVSAPRRGRATAAVVGVGLLAIGAGLATTRALEWMHRCTGADTELQGVWDDASQRAVKDALLTTEASYADDTWTRVESQLSAYADAWTAEYVDACEATRSRNEQSEADMGLRMGCLRQRKQHLHATVGELRRANAKAVEHAVQAVTSLPALDRCRDLEALRLEVPPPEDPAVAQQVVALDERLVDVKAKYRAGRYEEGLRLVDEVVAAGQPLDYEPLMSRAWHWQGELRVGAGDFEGAVEVLQHAYEAATAHGMQAEAADVCVALTRVLGNRLSRHDEAAWWSMNAESLSRAVGTDEARAKYLDSAGILAFSKGEYAEAREHFAAALAVNERALGPDHLDVGGSVNSLGNVMYSLGEHEQALALYERALAIREAALGPEHPTVASTLYNLGNVARLLAKYEQAQAVNERALAIWTETLGPEHLNVASVLNNMGIVAGDLGDDEAGRKLYERALAINEKVLGPNHRKVAHPLNNLGLLALKQRRFSEAQRLFTRVLAIWTETLGADHPHLIRPLGNLGMVAQAQGNHVEARDYFEQRLAIATKALGPEHPEVASSLTQLSWARLALGDSVEVLPLLERAFVIHTERPNIPAELAETCFALAHALWAVPAAQGGDRTRAIALAERAQEIFAGLGKTQADETLEVRQWLAERDIPQPAAPSVGPPG